VRGLSLVLQGLNSVEVDKLSHLERGLNVQASVLVDVRRRAVYVVNLKVHSLQYNMLAGVPICFYFVNIKAALFDPPCLNYVEGGVFQHQRNVPTIGNCKV